MSPLVFFVIWFLSAIPVGLILGRFLGVQDRKLCAQMETLISPVPAQKLDLAEHGTFLYQDVNQ
jgi:hypothetical protein